MNIYYWTLPDIIWIPVLCVETRQRTRVLTDKIKTRLYQKVSRITTLPLRIPDGTVYVALEQ